MIDIRGAALVTPNLRITSSVTDVNDGFLLPNDIVEYAFTIKNIGDDTATLVVFTDSIPSNTTYVPGTLQIDSVTKTDAGPFLGDEAEYSSGTVTMRVGTGASSLLGGSLAPNISTTVKFRVKVNAGTANGTAISNQSGASYSGLLLLDNQTTLSDSDLNSPGTQASIIIVNSSPPNIQLVHSILPVGNQLPGTNLAYTSVFTNSGGSRAQNFAVIEPIPSNTYFKLNSTTSNLNTTGLTLLTQYSNDGGVTYNYTPVSGNGSAPTGYDGNVNSIRFVFVGSLLSASPNNSGSVGFTAQIK